jgi:hypothetical protein
MVLRESERLPTRPLYPTDKDVRSVPTALYKEEIMNQNLKQCIYGAILLGGGLYLGNLYGQVDMLKATSSIVAGSHFDAAASNLDLHISLLNKLQANDTQKLSEKLEDLVNADLVALAQYSEVPSNRRMPLIIKSIKSAKEYRQTHPVAIQNDKVSKDIAKTFEIVK